MTLSGELSFATVPRLLTQAPALMAAPSLDLSGVTRCDSAGIAFLLELQRRTQAAGRPLHWTGASAQLLDLAQAYGLTGIMALAKT